MVNCEKNNKDNFIYTQILMNMNTNQQFNTLLKTV